MTQPDVVRAKTIGDDTLRRWQFKGDKAAVKMFVGKDCALGKNPNWDTKSKWMN